MKRVSTNAILKSTSALLTVAGVVGTALSPTIAAAQQLEEILVTAQKRSESVQEVPIAISAYDTRRLEESGFDGFEDLAALSPGLQLGNFGPVTFVNLRGIGNENTTAGGDPGVALHFDGVYLGRPVAFLFSAFDSERVEVLRGPQGTLYGRNAIGGSINYITKKPDQELGGEADILYGNYDWVRARAAINVPITDRISTRWVGFVEERDGFTEDLFPGGENPNDASNWGLRGHISFDISDTTSLLVSASYIQSGGVGTHPELREPYPGTLSTPPRTIGGPPGFAFSGGPPSGIPAGNVYIDENGVVPVNDLRPFAQATDADQRQDNDFLLISATFEHDFGSVSIKSITGYAESSYESLLDEDHSALPLSELLLEESSEQFSQELQILSNSDSRLQWIAGAYYFNEEATRRSQFIGGRYDVFADVFGVESGFDVGGDVETTAWAIFGEANYAVTDALKITAGVRYSNDKKDGVNRGFQFAGAPYADPVGDSWDEVTYRFVADYALNDDMLLYASYSTGYRSGGINQVAAISLGATTALFEPETVDAIEVGFKSNILDNRAQVNISAFRNDYADLQFQIFGPAGPEAFNAEGATVQGVELEIVAAVTEGLTINTAASYIDSEFDEQVISGAQIGGNQVQRTPKWTFNIGATQQWDLSKYGSLRLRGEFAYTGDIFYTALNRNAGFDEPGGSDFAESYENVNLRLFWDDPSERFTLEFAVTNLFDTAQEGNVFRGIGFLDVPGGGGPEEVTYNPPRQFSGRVGVKF